MTKCKNCGELIVGEEIEAPLFPGITWGHHVITNKFGCYWPDKKYKEDGRQMFAEG